MGLIDKLFGKRTPATSSPAPRKDAPTSSEFRGVEVIIDDSSCCTAVKALQGMRFLSDEVPALPVDQCNAATCQCSYKLFNDRRSDTRRTGDLIFDVASQIHPDDHRTETESGRRSDD